MLLLLKGAPPANPGVTFSLLSGLAFNNSAAVSFSTLTGFGGLDSVELRVSIDFDLHTALIGAAHVTVGPNVLFTTTTELLWLGGFTGSLPLSTQLSSGWTVGATREGIVTFGMQTALTGNLAALPAVLLGLNTGLSLGIPNLSGGTVTPAVSFGLLTSWSTSTVFVNSIAWDIRTDFTVTGGLDIPTLATQMRLTFSADLIRTFFRKG